MPPGAAMTNATDSEKEAVPPFATVAFSLGDALVAVAMTLALYYLQKVLLFRVFLPVSDNVRFAIFTVSFPMGLGLPIAWLVRRKGQTLVSAFRLHRSAWPRSFLIAITLTLAIENLYALVSRAPALAAIMPSPTPTLFGVEISRVSPLARAIGVVAALVLAPFSEELFFRGLLFGAFRSVLSTPCVVVFTSALFAYLHYTPWGIVPLTVAALSYAVAALWARSLAAAMMAHALQNLLALIPLLLL
jgi:membrane protease YdiL (CAAX protease family)